MMKLNFFDELLDGVTVEWKPLGEISEIYGGLTGKSKIDFENGNAYYISYKNIFGNIEVDFEKLESVKVSSSENQNEVKYGDVLFTGSSETADEAGMSSSITTMFDDSVFLNSFSFGIRFNDDIQILPEFSKYLFRSRLMRAEIAKTASGVTRFNVSKARFRKLQVPLPPFKVQQEIVRILDTFTKLTAELTAELTARKKQYTYYRDKLLSFEDGEVEWKALGEIGEFVRGNGLQKNDFIESGVGCIHYGQIYTFYGNFAYYTKSFVSPELATKLRKAQKGDIIIATTSENIEDVCKPLVWLGEDEVCVSGETYVFKHNQNPKYLAYYLQTPMFFDYKKKNRTGTKVIRVHGDKLAKFEVPLPSLSEQERIVSILDKFDALTSSITEGLPREIELRQKQYEYYRNMLLSFPKEEVEE